MKRLTVFTATAIVALAAAGVTGAVQAADLYIPPPDEPIYSPTMAPSVYFLLYGGAVGPSVVTYDAGGLVIVDALPGWGIGGAIGVGVVESLSVELDVFHTSRGIENWDDATLRTTSVMANLKGTLSVTEMVDVYAAAGLGAIHGELADDTGALAGWGPGYQVMIGASANVTDHVAIFGELRHQNTFQDIAATGTGAAPATSDFSIGGVNAVLVGIKVGM